MEVIYGVGTYKESDNKYYGKIILGENKLYLKGENGDIVQTYIPLEKIVKIKKTNKGVEIYFYTTMTFHFKAVLESTDGRIKDLVNDIVKKRCLKKTFLKREWKEDKA